RLPRATGVGLVTEDEKGSLSFPLLSDEPSTVDLLSFDAIAETVVDAVFDDALDPVAIGVSGAWGSGKTTVLELVKSRIEQDSGNGTSKGMSRKSDAVMTTWTQAGVSGRGRGWPEWQLRPSRQRHHCRVSG